MLSRIESSWLRTLAAPHGSLSYGVLARVAAFGAISVAVWYVNTRGVHLAMSVGFHEVAGAVIALALAFRTNTGYARFWEGRTLWGAIVNASRNVVRTVEAHGCPDAAEREGFATWVVVYAHATRRSLRGQSQDDEIAALLDPETLATFRAQPHRPLAAAAELSRRLRTIATKHDMNPFMVVHAESLIANLVDYLGGCERIRKTPTPYGFVLLVRRCIVFFLASLPLAMVDGLGGFAFLVTMAVAYPVLMIEALANELDDPFGHDQNDLPLSRICATIEKNLLGSEPPPSNAPPYVQD
jgi:putative membrane protein